MIHNKGKFILRLAALVALLAGLAGPASGIIGAASPAAAAPGGAVSPQGLLNPDGTLDLSSGFQGALDLRGWEVILDAERGPILKPALSAVTGWHDLPKDGLNNDVNALAVVGSDLYVGGDFDQNGDGTPISDNIVRYDTTGGGSWHDLPNDGLDNYVYALAVDGTDLYVGGWFTHNGDGTAVSDRIVRGTLQATLTVNKGGAGTGTVTSVPAGIHCGADCTETYDGGTVVILTATPDAKSDFAGWSGGCAGTGLTTQVTMNDHKTCTATFNLKQFTLTVNTVDVGGGTGTVTSAPAGIHCGADCTEVYDIDTLVTLTAHPGVKSYFVEWGGDCDGTDLTTQVTLDDDKACTATFGYPVGGIVVPVDKLGLLVPWMGLAALVGFAALGVVLVRRRRSN